MHVLPASARGCEAEGKGSMRGGRSRCAHRSAGRTRGGARSATGGQERAGGRLLTFDKDDALVALLPVHLVAGSPHEHVFDARDNNTRAGKARGIARVHVARDGRDLSDLRGEASGVRPRVALQVVDARSGHLTRREEVGVNVRLPAHLCFLRTRGGGKAGGKSRARGEGGAEVGRGRGRGGRLRPRKRRASPAPRPPPLLTAVFRGCACRSPLVVLCVGVPP